MRFGSPVVPEFGGADGAEGGSWKGARRLLKSTDAPLLTAIEVAARLRVCTATVYKMCSSGALPHVRVLNAVRVAEADLERFLAGRSRGR
jgi:excisionase family DNA binding protein